ncbi:MAG: hypothetical protein NXH75_17160, partial [Halobacteriovoraceae bacterium]|nr:hypothetical protein [Halobacteriovoraceae bacterium]
LGFFFLWSPQPQEKKAPLKVQKVSVRQAAPKKVIKKSPQKKIYRKPGISYKDRFEKITQTRFLDAKECLRLFGPQVNKVELKVLLKGKKGTPKAIQLSSPSNVSTNTKICLESLFSDILFPETKGKKEKLMIKKFTF